MKKKKRKIEREKKKSELSVFLDFNLHASPVSHICVFFQMYLFFNIKSELQGTYHTQDDPPIDLIQQTIDLFVELNLIVFRI